MKINLEYLKPGLCPLCGVYIGKNPLLVKVQLNYNTTTEIATCRDDLSKVESKEYQEALLEAFKKIWSKEIMENHERSEEDKQAIIKSYEAIKVL